MGRYVAERRLESHAEGIAGRVAEQETSAGGHGAWHVEGEPGRVAEPATFVERGRALHP